MEELTLTTPALLFSAVSLILLAYTNRFLSYAQLVRQLRDRYMENPSDITEAQIENLRKRLNLTRRMQGLGIASLFFCVVSKGQQAPPEDPGSPEGAPGTGDGTIPLHLLIIAAAGSLCILLLSWKKTVREK